MTLWLAEDSIDAEDIIENLVEEDERNVELLLIEDLTWKKTRYKLTNIFIICKHEKNDLKIFN